MAEELSLTGLIDRVAALDRAVAENGELIRDLVREQEADTHLRALHAEAFPRAQAATGL